MARKSETLQPVDDGLEDGLASAIAELENTAIEKARMLIAGEAQALREHIRKLEAHIVRLQQGAQPSAPEVTAAPKPAGTGKQPSVPVKLEPARRTAKPSRPRELPPLPAKRTLATLSDYLQSLGFTLVSYRTSGGGAWVFKTQEEFGHVVEHLKRSGVGVSRYPRGRKRYPGDHFEIDPSKVLPDT
jgi:hypothetical protein